MDPKIVFFMGVVGALAPEIVRAYNLRLNQKFTWSWGYIILSLPFIVLGGVIAFILPATTLWAAFYAGISTPIVVNTALRQAVSANSEKENKSGPEATLLQADKSAWKRFITAL
jgi:hypothetical protein